MEIFSSVSIGGLIGGLACILLWTRQINRWATFAVSILGALLGLATHTGLGGEGLIEYPGCEYFASSVGALLSLLLWCVAQWLFLAEPSKGVRD